jgi:DNA-binding Lrp family transcriptional regulator
VLVCIAQETNIRIRDIALRVGITERAASSIVADLEHEGYLTRVKVGRNNEYLVHGSQPLRHPVEQHQNIGELLQLLLPLDAARM